MKLESMSKNIVTIMKQLSINDGLARLLLYNIENPLDTGEYDNLQDVKRITGNDISYYKLNSNNKYYLPSPDGSIKLINPTSKESKILPVPFDTEAVLEDGSFIRVYYNDGEFNENEVIAQSQLHIDIICARSLWLMHNNVDSLIRPYEIMGRVIDLLGSRSLNKTIRLKFEGYQHLYINTKFDAIRLYCNYMSVET